MDRHSPTRRQHASAYDRMQDLPRLLPIWPGDLMDTTLDGRIRLVAQLSRALRRERKRGLAGHWAYDLARHRALARAYRFERDALR